jgi:hypothetical protein
MTKQIAKLLKATFQESSDLKQIAKELAGKGRGGDSMLVHITPKEAYMLKNAGGAGTINPDTGLLEFYDGVFKLSDYADFEAPNVSTGGYGSSRTASVATPEVGEFTPVSPYSFSSNAPQIDLTPPETAQYYGADVPQQRLYSSVNFTPRPAPIDISTDTGFVPSTRTLDVQNPYGPGSPTEYGFEPVSLSERVKSTLTSPRVLENITMGGLAALPGIIASRNASKQGQRAREDMEKMATPYRQRSAELLAQAQSGELSAGEQQQIQAMQARLAQGAAGRGGPGAEQALNQLEVFRQQLLTDKYRLGLQVAGIADQIATGAIKAGLQADQYVSELTGNYFANAMQMAMQGMTGNQPSMARRQLGA